MCVRVATPRTYVSLGGWCGPALILGKLGLRTAAYPFDFTRCTLDGVLHFLQHGFDGDTHGFFPPGPPPYTPECVGPWLLFRGVHTAFAHYNLNDARVRAYFAMTFARLHALLDRARVPVTFVRTVTARHPMDELRLADALERTLQQRNPRLDYRIVFVVHEQGLLPRCVALAPLSPRATLWALRYHADPATHTLFDCTVDGYAALMRHSIDEANWPPPPTPVVVHDAASKRDDDNNNNNDNGSMTAATTTTHRALCGVRTDATLRPDGPAQLPLDALTLTRFPWRAHNHLALIDGTASVGGTCVGVGSTHMVRDTACAHSDSDSGSSSGTGAVTRWRCAYCGNDDYHRVRRASSSLPARPFSEADDVLLVAHLAHVLSGADAADAVERLATQLHRSAYDIVTRARHLALGCHLPLLDDCMAATLPRR